MHWKGLRLVADGSSKRQSTIEPPTQARRSEHLPRPSPPETEPRHSEALSRSPGLDMPVDVRDAKRGVDALAESGPDHGVAPTDFAGESSSGLSADTPSLRRNRFSFMRLRHASDPQLSKSYAKAARDTPPAPTIITTAPTSNELDQPVKQRSKLNFFPLRKRSMEELTRNSVENPRTQPARKSQGSTDSQIDESTLSTSQNAPEEPGRLSTTSRHSGNQDQLNDSHRTSVVDPRFSESSRSDQSYGDQTFRTNSPREGQASTSTNKRFRMPRLKRNRSPLFPLPPKPTPASRALDNAPKFPPAETPKSQGSDEGDQVSPLPSPSRSSVGLAPTAAPPLFRNDSTASARSVRSTPSYKGGRGRSSTMGSLAENQEDLSPPPYLASSSRTSTSTTGRKSFGDIFNISQRLRQNSEPPPRDGSTGIGGAATPDDTAASYLTKLEEHLPRGVIGGILAQSDDEFYKVGLRKYMRSFSYFGDPIDMAIRKLLMEVELPKETQQIDRFLQSFADRYHECNPGIFASSDQAYFIAFSILILHTDVFNKNNKRKMQKPDYVKNTRGEGIAEEILECFYENISYTPFIRVEDASLRDRQMPKPRRALFNSPSSENLSRMAREPVDPYTLIMENKVDSLRPSLKDVMDLDDTYSHFGTSGPPDMEDLHQAFTKAGILQIVSLRSRPDAFMQTSLDNPAGSHPGLVDIKVAKVGLLWRKDPKKKKTRSPWGEWGAILTFSQLYFFRNITWVRSLMAQYDAYVRNGRQGTLVFRPPLADFKPDAIMSTNDAVALLDSSYKKHKHAFSFVRHGALEEVFLASTEPEMNDWIAKLNYAAAFRTTGVRTKGMIATNYEGQRYRRSQRVGSQSSLASLEAADKEPKSPSIDTDIVAGFVAARQELMTQKIREQNEKLFVTYKQLDDLLRDARHLQILAPVHPRAREGVIMAAGRIAAKLKWVRQDIWRNKCYREVLLRDLGEVGSLDERSGSVADETISSSGPARLASPSRPSLRSDASVHRAPSVTRPVSSHDTNEPTSASSERPIESGLLKQPSSDEMRRPSIPGSTTSSDFGRVGRPLSVAILSEQGRSETSAGRMERDASVLSRGSKFDGASLGSRASKVTSPASYDDGEERFLRETGLLDLSGSPPPKKQPTPVPEADAEDIPDEISEVSHSDNKPSRVRRSLHRTLREPHVHRHQSRTSKKNRESVSSIGALDDNESITEGEVLSRKSPSFTVHGKKASIVTFGSEWQNMSPEERLKLRKPTHEEPRASESAILGGASQIAPDSYTGDRPYSVRSASTTTGVSLLSGDEPIEFFRDAQENLDDSSEVQSPKSTAASPGSVPEQPLSEKENTIRSTSGSGSVIHHGHLTTSTDGQTPPSPSSTSLNERRAVNTPSSENLRQQAVGA
ncbi:uncharacterized protein N7477_003225 [Penicillium maclennaniae]|uniref:uncharacterized protein n=1 Tax=Penicillium maclennaniae TaxID=1343394 RepID=UPI0025402E16|nr:uncharacterized protein N7477_003225 [Penicillium maclennaniae]KAJ5677592.1 hypothetical protein N7477_003225 [Penicillium maclennaniae]